MQLRLLIVLLVVALVGAIYTGLLKSTSTGRTSSQEGTTVEIISAGKTYPVYIATPPDPGRKPAVLLIHSINGFEQGYRDLTDKLAAEGYVVLSPQWQTFERTPTDAAMEQLLRDVLAYLRTRPDVDPERLGLTGFCIGGRYTMLFFPLLEDFKSAVAWYGFPYRGGSAEQPTKPADVIEHLTAPMLIIHGTADQPSPIADIYQYATALDSAGKYFELKVYQGQPHGFMLRSGQISDSFSAEDAYREMMTFFHRTLR